MIEINSSMHAELQIAAPCWATYGSSRVKKIQFGYLFSSPLLRYDDVTLSTNALVLILSVKMASVEANESSTKTIWFLVRRFDLAGWVWSLVVVV